jgi:hypothetical protein
MWGWRHRLNTSNAYLESVYIHCHHGLLVFNFPNKLAPPTNIRVQILQIVKRFFKSSAHQVAKVRCLPQQVFSNIGLRTGQIGQLGVCDNERLEKFGQLLGRFERRFLTSKPVAISVSYKV